MILQPDRSPAPLDAARTDEAMPDDVLTFLRERRDVDFRVYRRATIERQLLGRMRLAGVATYSDYLHRLAEDPSEVDRAVAHLTIKVSQFFRNPSVFDLLRGVVLPDLMRRRLSRPLQVWSAGCGNGEEPYSLAILLSEATGGGADRDFVVYATDVDEQALAVGRAGRYRPEALTDLPPATVAGHFTTEVERGRRWCVVRDTLKPRVHFLRHDLTVTTESPLALAFDLICCRNVLIYFNRPAQQHAQKLMYNSLVPGGYLCLGEAEWLLAAVEPAFDVVDHRGRLFRVKSTQACTEKAQ